MKILKWNIDKSATGYKINKAKTTKVISYRTLTGEVVCESAKDIRKQPLKEVSFGRVINKMDMS